MTAVSRRMLGRSVSTSMTEGSKTGAFAIRFLLTGLFTTGAGAIHSFLTRVLF